MWRAQPTVSCTTHEQVVLKKKSINWVSQREQISKQHSSMSSVRFLPTSLHDELEAGRWNERFPPQADLGQCFVMAIESKLGQILNTETVTNQISENDNRTKMRPPPILAPLHIAISPCCCSVLMPCCFLPLGPIISEVSLGMHFEKAIPVVSLVPQWDDVFGKEFMLTFAFHCHLFHVKSLSCHTPDTKWPFALVFVWWFWGLKPWPWEY